MFFRLSPFLLLLLIALPFVAAEAGVNLPPLPQRTFFFEPGAEYEWTWSVFGSERLDVSISGDLTDYAYLEDDAPGTGPRAVTWGLKLPEDLSPGRYVVYLTVIEGAPDAGMVGARAAARGGVVINSVYPTPYLTATLNVPSIAAGEPTVANLALKSWSAVDVAAAWADLEVFKEDGTSVLTARAPPVPVPARGSAAVTADLETAGLSPGPYEAVATVYGAQDDVVARSSFRIGTLDLELVGVSPNATVGEIERVEFVLESNWNEEVSDVFGTAEVAGASSTSPTVSIGPFGQGTLVTYLDFTAQQVPGNYTGELLVSFRDDGLGVRSKAFPFELELVPPPASPFRLGLAGWLSVGFGLVIVLLVIALFLVLRKRKE